MLWSRGTGKALPEQLSSGDGFTLASLFAMSVFAIRTFPEAEMPAPASRASLPAIVTLFRVTSPP